ncbi:unnamed protein product [Medioppia subpectinata]|uniref:Protein NATD1 n=1 Tax=Medioppia subpectinata TaxID=1979941 RepID=A0A7R9PUU2_9ACAR|nr:unnamed protein product [Medioppia subpectinata]CAD7644456.1 unnamed protein product [Medioppia subpectinata]CAG2102121.1 unnamed protein product [Medioppia subpectinata]CAG2120113.1 unnamed protein product [Medioppia subpectinata]
MSIIRRFATHLIQSHEKATQCHRRTLLADKRVTSLWTMSSFQFSSVTDLQVKHNVQKKQFYIELGKAKAVLDYKQTSAGVLDLYHTEVPKELRGKGIAGLLAEEAFKYVVKNKLQMLISCTYLQKFLKENQKPEFVKYLYRDSTE